MFHLHKWEEKERHHSPKITLAHYSNMNGPPSIVQEIMMGVTTLVFRCSKCGDVKTEKVLGDARKEAVK